MQYLRDNAGVLESSANGTTWEPVQIGNELQNPCVLGTLQIRDNAGVLEVSDDDGATWEQIRYGTPPFHIIIGNYSIPAAQTKGDRFLVWDAGYISFALPDITGIPDGAIVTIQTLLSPADISPSTGIRILTSGGLGEPGQGLYFEASITLALFTDVAGQLGTAGARVWFLVDSVGAFSFLS
jgi:hypothetical protein